MSETKTGETVKCPQCGAKMWEDSYTDAIKKTEIKLFRCDNPNCGIIIKTTGTNTDLFRKKRGSLEKKIKDEWQIVGRKNKKEKMKMKERNAECGGQNTESRGQNAESGGQNAESGGQTPEAGSAGAAFSRDPSPSDFRPPTSIFPPTSASVSASVVDPASSRLSPPPPFSGKKRERNPWGREEVQRLRALAEEKKTLTDIALILTEEFGKIIPYASVYGACRRHRIKVTAEYKRKKERKQISDTGSAGATYSRDPSPSDFRPPTSIFPPTSALRPPASVSVLRHPLLPPSPRITAGETLLRQRQFEKGFSALTQILFETGTKLIQRFIKEMQ